jgi:hypothetical protein
MSADREFTTGIVAVTQPDRQRRVTGKLHAIHATGTRLACGKPVPFDRWVPSASTEPTCGLCRQVEARRP